MGMKVSECMSRDVRTIGPEQTLAEAAQLMAEIDAGSLPVGENDRLVGVLTDRDIAVRAVAAGKGPQTLVRDVMSAEVKYSFEDEDVTAVTANMGELQVRRLPVVSRDKRLVGIVSIGDLARCKGNADKAGQALEEICRTGGEHNQSLQH